jgi:hypothetical protein
MKKNLLLSVFTFLYLFSTAQVFEDEAVAQNYAAFNLYSAFFNKAYEQNPEVPRGILEAVAFTNTRFNHAIPNEKELTCTGIPKTYGVMGLTLDGKNAFKNNLVMISELSGYSIQEIIESPEKNILAYAKAYSILKDKAGISTNVIEDQVSIIMELSELPVSSERNNVTLAQNFAANANIYSILDFLNKSQYQSLYKLPQRNINLIAVFGQENYNVLSAPSVVLSAEGVSNRSGDTFKGNIPTGIMSPDYGPALWVAACVNNYTYGRSMAVTAVAIHDMEGTYAGTISWFASCDNPYFTSSEYVMRSSDGQCTQMVLESNTGHHVYTENDYTIGIEHEGYYNQTGWYTTAMYNSSAALVRSICSRHSGVSTKAAWYGPSCDGNYNQCLVDQCIRIKGHQMFPNGGHMDPGLNWDWRRYYHLLNPMPAVTPLTAASGNTFDSGGASGNYANSERPFTLIAPTGASKITLTFTSFNLEANADNLFIYDGNTTAAPLIGKYTGTTSPGTIVSSGGSLLLEFRSDCSQTSTGWAASWTAPGVDNTAPTTSITAPTTWITQNFTASFTDVDNSGGSGIEKSMYHVVDYDGAEWRANNTLGFFRDNFNNAIHSDWATNTGTWAITGGYLQQSDESVANTNISAPLTQNLSNRYLYNWSGKIDGAGTSRRAGLHFMCDNATSPNRGNGYFVWFRADQSQLEIYKSVNDVLGSAVKTVPVTINAGTWYDYKVVYDRSTGEIDVYVANNLITTWTDSSPIMNGSYISFRNGDCKYSIDNLQVYRSRSASTTISVGAASTNAIRYQNTDPSKPAGIIKSIVMDNAGNFSTVASQSVDVDWTAPVNVTGVNDGTTTDINTTSSTTKLSANWNPTIDPHSDVVKYWYAIGKTPGATNVVNWTDNGLSTAVTKTGLSLTVGQMYYFSVKAEDGAGLISTAVSSDGQLVQVSTAIAENENAFNLSAFPNPFKDNIKIAYELKENQSVKITLVDVLGKEIVIEENDNQSAGSHSVDIDAIESGLAQGAYVVKLKTGESEAFIKLIHY